MSQPVQGIPLVEIPLERRRPVQLGEWRNCVAARGLGLLTACLGPHSACAFGILTYHRVAHPPAGLPAPTWNVAPAQFRAQMQGLLARGYRPWPLREALACHRGKRTVPPKRFVVTFDDGYENVYASAFSVLREYDVPATVFLATAHLDQQGPFPFDDWRCAGAVEVPAETWRPLTTAQCAEMSASGLIELGSHTHSHADFRDRPQAFRRDLALSLEVLRVRFGVRDPAFAFPFSHGCRRHDGPELAEAAKEAGMRCALTNDSECVRPGDDPFNWGRFAALGTDSAASLAAKLGGWYGLARKAWHWARRRADRGRRPNGQVAASPVTR